MDKKYSVRFGFIDENVSNSKTVQFDTEEAADRFYGKVLHHASNRKRPMHGCVALWNEGWRVKFQTF